MNIEIIPVYEYLDQFIVEAENKPAEINELWQKHAIEPFWSKLCEYSPIDLTERKPACIKNIESLKKQLQLLKKIDLNKLKEVFEKITNLLPNYDDDPIVIGLYPLGEENRMINEKQNGVIGTSLFGNNIIAVNPMINEYEKWIPYVFAHEYHHTVLGNYWFNMHGGELGNEFINSLLIDGQADSFAMHLNPALRPQWLFSLSDEEIKILWENNYKKLVFKDDVDYGKYMFGGDNIPWCAGYAVGYWLTQKYLQENTEKAFKEILEIKPIEILKLINSLSI